MAFTQGQLVNASDLNNLSVTSVTAAGAVTAGSSLAVGTTLSVGGASTLAAVTATSLASSGPISGTTGTLTGPLDMSGAASGQITFPAVQNVSAGANVLDDYEEGVWTPTIGGSGGQSGQAYAVQVGRYIKIGRLVTAQFRIQLSTLGTITTDVQIKGLPFTAEPTPNMNWAAAMGRWQNMTTAYVALAAVVAQSTTVLTLSGATGAATQLSLLAQADLSSTTILEGTVTYAAAT